MIQSFERARREAGDRSIADKIIKRLHDLEKTVENNQGRWAWELLQNAKDSIAEDNRRVSVQIKLDENSVEFKHNGTHFTAQDVIGLISQISSKEVEEGQQTAKTGRFGTGFLTTHLLSRVVTVKGILKQPDNSFRTFEILLDRQGRKTSQLMPRIANSWDTFHKSVQKIDSDYNRNQFNTSFCYELQTEEHRKIALIGVKEFSQLIPFVLTFVPKIGRVEIVDNVTQNITSFKNKQESRDTLITHISKIKNKEETSIFILPASDDQVEIATEVEKSEEGYLVKSIKNFPKLFCDFPLIGTENFHFPVIINSFFFNPKTERDGIWLKGINDQEVQENKKLLESAVKLYAQLIANVAEKTFFDLYNLAETKIPSTDGEYLDKEWYKKFVQQPLRELVYNAKIVELEGSTSEKISIKQLYLPTNSFSKEIKEKMWQFMFDLAPQVACRKVHLHDWCNVSWEDWETVDYSRLLKKVEKQEHIPSLSKLLQRDENNTLDWLNSLYAFILEDENNLILFNKISAIPNQNGVLKKKADLYIDEIQDDELISILELLGEEWKDMLLHDNIDSIRDYLGKKEKSDISSRITKTLKEQLKKPSSDNSNKAINLLCEWFENNSEHGEELFSELYRKRAEIFMNTIQDKESLYRIMRNSTDISRLAEVAKAIKEDSKILEKIESAKTLTALLEEFKAEDISDLKNMLRLAQNVLADDSNKIEITHETLLSLGVTSLDELNKALRDKGIAAEFIHTSTPTVEMFIAVQKLITRAKDNVVEHLKSLENYDCTDLEELATTVIGGIKKHGLPIYIVIRPSNNGEVIIYYSSEKDTLDSPDSELWIDNNIDKPRRLTLGKIIKTTGINRIPV